MQRVYKGVVVGWRDIAAASPVPPLFWYVADAEKARGDEATPGSMAFDAGDGQGLRYYDRVRVLKLLYKRTKHMLPRRTDALHHAGEGAPAGQRPSRWRRAANQRRR
jgi:hypothetical protein